MNARTWIVITEAAQAEPLLAAASPWEGRSTAVVVGGADVARHVADLGLSEVLWFERAPGLPADAYAAAVATLAEQRLPRVLLSTAAPSARALLGAAAARIGASVVAGATLLRDEGDQVVIERPALAGRVIETVSCPVPVAVILGAMSAPSPANPGTAAPAGIDQQPADGQPFELELEASEPTASAGVGTAPRVVSVGRGLRSRNDVALIETLAAALDAEIACSMPVADDLGWIAKERYVGRSGQHIAPRLYLAIGISGAPQHMEGVRQARVVVAINADPEAPIFRSADYGIVGDLYDVVPALVEALDGRTSAHL